MPTSIYLASAALCLAATCFSARATQLTEPPDFPEFPDNGPVSVLGTGDTTFSGQVTSGGDDTQDRFQVQIPAGFEINLVTGTFANGSEVNFNPAITFDTVTFVGNGTNELSLVYPLLSGTYQVQTTVGFGVDAPWSLVVTVNPVPDYRITTDNNTIRVRDVSGNGDTLGITQPSPGTIRFAAPGRTFGVDGAPGVSGNSGDLPLAGITRIEVFADDGNDTIEVGAMSSIPSLRIDAGDDNDTINLNGDLTFLPDASLDLDLFPFPGSGTDSIILANGTNIVTSGSGKIELRCSKTVVLNSGSGLETVNGDLTVEGNLQDPPTIGTFRGVQINGSTITCTGTGAVTVRGRGGDGSGGFQIGVDINQGTISGGTNGTVTVDGTGGASTNFVNRGVTVFGSNATITSLGGPVTVTGRGGPSGSDFGIGVALLSGGTISAGGSGAVQVTGIGDGPGGSNQGIEFGGIGSRIFSPGGGDITLTGSGGTGTGTGFGLRIAGDLTSEAIVSAGNITLGMNSFSVASTGLAETTSPSGSITLRGDTDSVLVRLGAADTDTTLGLPDALLDKLQTNTLIVDARQRTLELTGPVSPANATDLVLASALGILPFAAGTDLEVAGTVRLDAGLFTTINGTTPESDYPLLGIAGAVDLNGVVLLPTVASGVGALGRSFLLVDNDGSDPITGTFVGLPEGATLDWAGSALLDARISYLGGDGNDAVLTLASVFEVATTADSGPGSLRDALAAAAANPGHDTITFDLASFDGGPSDVLALSSPLLVDSAVTIDASAIPGGVTLDGGSNGDDVLDPGENRCLTIAAPGGSPVPVTLRNLTIRNGAVAGPGGNIYNEEDLTLENCRILNGRTIGADNDGGGIHSLVGRLTMRDCTVSGNRTFGNGADGPGVVSSGATHIERCLFHDNQTLGQNSNGGALALFTTTTTLINTTIDNNVCTGDGGGIFQARGSLDVVHATITNNGAGNSGGGIASLGDDPAATTTVAATIIRDNGGGDLSIVNAAHDPFRSSGSNIVGGGNGAAAFIQPGDLTGTAIPVNLAPLGDFGGPTLTRAPAVGSPAIDGVVGTTPATLLDQRSLPRPVGTPDIGAVEVNLALVTNPLDDGPGSLREAIRRASPGQTIIFDLSVFDGQPADTVHLASQLEITKSLTLDASFNSANVVIDGGSDGDTILDPGETRCLFIESGDPFKNLDVTLRGLTIRNGVSAENSAGANILSRENLTLEDCSVTLGRAVGPNAVGAGLCHLDGNLVINRSTFSFNECSGGSSFGGGIYNDADPTDMATITNSSFHGNETTASGGAFFNDGTTTNFSHCTVTANTASTGGGIAGTGSSQTSTVLFATIVRDNSGGDVEFVFGGSNSFSSLGDNILNTGNASGIFTGPGDDRTVTPINLSALGSFGGRTPTLLPLAGSPAIDRAAPGVPRDQRGITRDTQPDIGAVEASALVVTTTVDENDGVQSGAISLRDAIAATPTGGTVYFDPAVFPAAITLLPGNGELSVSAQVLTIDGSTINGEVAVSGGDAVRVFNVDNLSSLTVRDLTVRDGFTTGPGGGIRTSGNLTLENVRILDNAAGGGGGGMEITGSTTTMTDCTISGNSTTQFGAGIKTRFATTSTNFKRCTFDNNTGIFGAGFKNETATTTFENCTFANNNGDGIRNDNSGIMFVRYCTVVGNTGAGINNTQSSAMSLENSIVSGNSPDITGDSSPGLVGDNFIGGAPRLTTLADFGTPTRIMAPLPGSPVIQGASSFGGTIPPTDQRGAPRPVAITPDIGAVEAFPFTTVALVDSDSDGIDDRIEPALGLVVGNDDSAVDSDGDGDPDAQEIANMTDHLDPSDLLQIDTFEFVGYDGANRPQFRITFSTFPGLDYSIESDTALIFGGLPIFGPVTATGFDLGTVVTLDPAGRDFVRIVRH